MGFTDLMADMQFLSTPSARRATVSATSGEQTRSISIHALREEGDHRTVNAFTPSTDFYPRPPRGGRLALVVADAGDVPISIHALREEGDASVLGTIVGWVSFLSTPSARRATDRVDDAFLVDLISIHALREEGDDETKADDEETEEFLSTPSARRATDVRQLDAVDFEFLSTPSARRATMFCPYKKSTKRISIHALREEGDSRFARSSAAPVNFYPRPPRGGRQQCEQLAMEGMIFLSTPSARRATCSSSLQCRCSSNFYPRPPRGGRRA